MACTTFEDSLTGPRAHRNKGINSALTRRSSQARKIFYYGDECVTGIPVRSGVGPTGLSTLFPIFPTKPPPLVIGDEKKSLLLFNFPPMTFACKIESSPSPFRGTSRHQLRRSVNIFTSTESHQEPGRQLRSSRVEVTFSQFSDKCASRSHSSTSSSSFNLFVDSQHKIIT